MPPDPAASDDPLPPADPAVPDDFSPVPGCRLPPLPSPLLPAPPPVAPELDVPDGAASRSLFVVAPSEPAASSRRFTDGTSPSRLTPLGPFFAEPEWPAPWSDRSFGMVGLTCAAALPTTSSDESRITIARLSI